MQNLKQEANYSISGQIYGLEMKQQSIPRIVAVSYEYYDWTMRE